MSWSNAGGPPPAEPLALRRAIWSDFSGQVNLIPRRRSARRVEGWEYALSAITRSGGWRGRPGPRRATDTSASSGSSCGLSPACPAVSSTAMGSPRPSTARCSLVVSPPRDRPRASPSTARSSTQPVAQPPFPRSGGVLVSSHGAGVDREGPLHRADRVVLDDHLGQDPIPGAIGGPPAQPLMGGLPRPLPFGRVGPRNAGLGLPQDRVDHLPVIAPPPTPTTGRGQQRLDPRPRGIGEFMSADHHTKRESHPCKIARTGPRRTTLPPTPRTLGAGP